MSYIYKERTQTYPVVVGGRCDGCGAEYREFYSLIRVAIEVNHLEEGGARDEYDYCETCLLDMAPKLIAAGSKAPLITEDTEEGS